MGSGIDTIESPSRASSGRASDSGREQRQDADGGVLDAMVVSGRYRIWIATPSAAKRTTFVRLRGAPQADAPGTAGVTVR